jgi:hypothetical protein
MTDTTDKILEIIAQVTVTGGDIVDAFGLSNVSPEARSVFLSGIRAIQKNREHEHRLRLKILALNPDHYELLRQRAEEYQKQQEQKPSYQTYLRTKAKKEEERKAEFEESMAVFRESMKKVDEALRFYSEWKLSSGKTLGEATKADLLSEVELNRSTADGLMRNCTFYSSLADRVPEGKTVAQSVNLVEAHQLREAAYTG